jgi:hypothetical protein
MAWGFEPEWSAFVEVASVIAVVATALAGELLGEARGGFFVMVVVVVEALLRLLVGIGVVFVGVFVLRLMPELLGRAVARGVELPPKELAAASNCVSVGVDPAGRTGAALGEGAALKVSELITPSTLLNKLFEDSFVTVFSVGGARAICAPVLMEIWVGAAPGVSSVLGSSQGLQ